MSQLILNTKQNIRYESVSLFYPEIIKSIHNQSPFLKKYSWFIISQIYWTSQNSQKNSLMPINILQKDSQSSDPYIRADAIKMLTDMCDVLNDIYPFIYEILKSGIHE